MSRKLEVVAGEIVDRLERYNGSKDEGHLRVALVQARALRTHLNDLYSGPHHVIFSEDGWIIEHTLDEREKGAMGPCTLNAFCSTLTVDSYHPGRYQAVLINNNEWEITPCD